MAAADEYASPVDLADRVRELESANAGLTAEIGRLKAELAKRPPAVPRRAPKP